MTIITLTTDFGHKDYSVAMTKGALYNEVPEITIVDITHQVSPYNHSQAAYILKTAFKTFPKGSIHIIGVESEYTPENIHLVMLFDGHYFIGADNGIFSLITENLKPEKVIKIAINQEMVSSFPVVDVFAKVAGHLARKGNLNIIGNEYKNPKELIEVKPVVNPDGNQILGSVIYIDNYGNVVTNITEKYFYEIGKSRKFTVFARSVKFNSIYKSYSQFIDFSIPYGKRKDDGKKLALFNSAGHLEFAIYRSNPETFGSASSLFGLDYRDAVTIKFE